jgi:hypothetical protein
VDLSIGALVSRDDMRQHVPLATNLRDHPGVVLFEYDLDGAERPPAVFVGLTRDAPADADYLIALSTGLAAPIPSAIRETLRQCCEAAAEDAWITHVGSMLNRRDRPLRLNIGGRSPDSLRRYVADINAPSAIRDALNGLLALVEPHQPALILALDVADRPSARVGLECYPADSPDAWHAFVHTLRRRRLCAAAEEEAIRDWPGWSLPTGQAQPVRPRWLEAFVTPGPEESVVRSTSHVKLVMEHDAKVRAKAYLSLRHASMYVAGSAA